MPDSPERLIAGKHNAGKGVSLRAGRRPSPARLCIENWMQDSEKAEKENSQVQPDVFVGCRTMRSLTGADRRNAAGTAKCKKIAR